MGDNPAAFEALDAHLERLKRVQGINEEAAPDIADGFEKLVRSNVAAQVDPYGHPFYPSKDGLPVLINAAEHVTTTAKGTTITQELTGVEVRHQNGSAKGYHGGSLKLGGFRRPIIPFNKLPGPFKAVCRDKLQTRFNIIFAGGK